MPMKTAPMSIGTNEIAIHSFHLPTKSIFQLDLALLEAQ